MPDVMTTNGSAQCGKQGDVRLTSSAKLKVGGAAVLTSAETKWSISGCTPAGTEKACTIVSSVTATISTKLAVSGNAVLLSPVSGTTDGTDAVFMSKSAGQSKLKAV